MVGTDALTADVASPVMLVTASGERVERPEFEDWVADVDVAKLRELYADMAIVRRIDTEATALQRQGELALWAPLLGQEASQVGSARALRPDDFVFSSYREHAVAYVKGATPAALMHMSRGTTHTGWDPFALSMAPMQIIIGAQSLHATGYAMGIAMDGGDEVALSYFGDGATSQGNVNEAMVFAASFTCPVVFFCQNNQYAISEPVRLQSKQELVNRAAGFGIPAVQVDGNDVLAVMAATRLALHRARSGGGPTFIEAVTYRMGPHTTSDDPTRYRPAAEIEEWRQRDPLARVERLLTFLGEFDDAFAQDVATRVDQVASDVRAACLALVDPEPQALFDHVYAEHHTSLVRQSDQHRRYLSMFEETSK